jgi:phospholipid/cholesterol/gamma-HCH transport system substrate-binding protein
MAGAWGVAGRFIAFALACVLGLVFLTNTMTNRAKGDTNTYHAIFTNVGGLRPGDDVRAAGVRVGRVESVELQGAQARVTFSLTREQPLTSTTHLTLRFQSLLGQRYVAMAKDANVGAAAPGGALPDGATLPVSRTDPGFDLTALLNGFEPLFATLKPAEVNQLAESIAAVLQGQGGTIESLLGNTASLTNRLADDSQLIDTVLTALTPVLEEVAGRGERVDSTIADLRSLLKELDEEHKRIGTSIDGVSELSNAASALVSEVRKPLRHDVRTLREFSRISVEQRKAINALLEFLPVGGYAFARPFSSGAWLNIFICNMEIDLGAGEIPVGIPNGKHSEACS